MNIAAKLRTMSILWPDSRAQAVMLEGAAEIDRLEAERDELAEQLSAMTSMAEKFGQERNRLRAALEHQQSALRIVRDRQRGVVSVADLNQGIALIDAALGDAP